MKTRTTSSLSDTTPKDRAKASAEVEFKKKVDRYSHTLYWAFSEELKTEIIIKAFPEKGKRLNSLFLREARFHKLRHPNLQAILDVIPASKSGKIPYEREQSVIIAKKPEFGDFYSLILSKKLPRDELIVRTFFHQLIAGIEYIHSKGVAHMDIRLENLFLDTNFTLKLGNFMLSQGEDDESVVESGRSNDQRSETKHRKIEKLAPIDIYGAGMVLFIMYTHYFPYMLHGVSENFLEEYCKSNNICQDFVDLFRGMIDPSPPKRLTLDEIKRSKWYQKPVYCSEELSSLLTKLKL